MPVVLHIGLGRTLWLAVDACGMPMLYCGALIACTHVHR